MADGYEQHYSDDNLWTKLRSFALTAGKDVVEMALILYFVLQKPGIPSWAKATVISALGYFIFPLDLIPDFTPVVGYADDLGFLAAAIGAVAMHIDDDVRGKARNKLREWFGDDGDSAAPVAR